MSKSQNRIKVEVLKRGGFIKQENAIDELLKEFGMSLKDFQSKSDPDQRRVLNLLQSEGYHDEVNHLKKNKR